MHVREVHQAERDWLRAVLRQRWADDIVVAGGRVRRPAELPALVALDDTGERVGIATYSVHRATAELVTLDALRPAAGVGRPLLAAVAAAAREVGATRLQVTTTNDNTAALRFYQRAGFRLVTLRPGAVEEARAIKPSIPARGYDEIPIRDELDLALDL
jgi:ribosomal protein S18 acetylase RimI-like enzyme